MTNTPKAYVARKLPLEPFTVEQLPLISRLQLIGYHRYKNRWAKRFGKKLGRMTFDIAYNCLKLSGQGRVSANFTNERRRFEFDARKLHFSRLFDNECGNVCEPELATLLETFLTADKVFYDIGANWGYFSLYAAALPNYNGPIHAFEPIEETFADLRSWVAQTGKNDRVTCHNLALSDSDGTAQMGVVPDNSGLASLARARDTDSEKRDVRTCRLDGFKLPEPDFIKLDVEGFEPEVIQGGHSVLTSKKPMMMFENWIIKDDAARTLLPMQTLLNYGFALFTPAWWIGPPTNEIFHSGPYQGFPTGPKLMAYVPFDIEKRFELPDQVNFFCCHKERLSELEGLFDVLD